MGSAVIAGSSVITLSMKSAAIVALLLVLLAIPATDAAGFTNDPAVTSIYEDDNDAKTIWNIEATCTEIYTYREAYQSSTCGQYGPWGSCWWFDYRTSYRDVERTRETSCTCTCEPDTNIFSFSDPVISRKQCNSQCNSCSGQEGCLEHRVAPSYDFSVYCEHSSNPNAGFSRDFTVDITQNTSPELQNGGTVSVSKVSARTLVWDSDHIDNEGDALFAFDPSPDTAYQTGLNLWEVEPASGDLTAAYDTNYQYSKIFTFSVCGKDRRNKACKAITLTLTACFQIPECSDLSRNDIDDSFDGVLFDQITTTPTDHFYADFSRTWPSLHFEMVDDDGFLVGDVDASTGQMTTTGNISVHPSYPSKTFNMVVRISELTSCWTRTCNNVLEVFFKNHDIEILSLPGEVEIFEDDDSELVAHYLITYDYNNNAHDNVTCWLSNNPDTSMFEMRESDTRAANGREHEYYDIVKLACQEPLCGFICDDGTGCMNFQRIPQYTIEVTCRDGYGSVATAILTVNVGQNHAFVFTNLPATITLDSDETANQDRAYSFLYSDVESEPLHFNYTITPTTNFFETDAEGNFHNSLANVTLNIHHWSEATDLSFTFYVCGADRRNLVCDNLVINIINNCDEDSVPTCVDDENSITDQFPVGGTLFTINVPAIGSHNILSYAIASSAISYFTLSQTTREITLAAAFTPARTGDTYYISAFVYDSEACQYATCTLKLSVSYTNFPIAISNLPATVPLHESTTEETELLRLAVADDNTDDTVSCTVDDAACVPPNTDQTFFTRETYPGSMVFNVLSKAGPEFDFDVTSEHVVRIVCVDALGLQDSKDLTVSLSRNQEQAYVGLDPATGHSLQFDLTTLSVGDTLYTAQTTDAEGDAITYSCDVANSNVPMRCDSTRIYMRRAMAESEEDSVFTITMHATDAVNNYVISIVFTITFVIENTKPVISDPPTGLTFPEMSPDGTPLYTVTVTDPDVGDSVTVSYVLDPASASSLFSFNTLTFELTLASGQTFDYETRNSYTFTFSASDGTAAAEVPKSLTIGVTNINEAPVFTLTSTALTIPEGPASATPLATLNYTCEDVDGDTVSLAIVGTSNFALDPNNGQLTYTTTWDLEAGDSTSTSLTIACSDAGGLSDQASLSLTIDPVNEFTPVPTETYVELNISGDTRLTDVLYTITATDQDYGDDGIFVFSVLGVGIGKQTFTVTTNGELKLKAALDLNYDRRYVFNVIVSDGESSRLFGTVLFNVSFTSTYVPEMPTRPTYCTTCTLKGRVVVASIAIACALLLAFFLWVAIHFIRIYACPPQSANSIQNNANQRFQNTKQEMRRNRRQRRKEEKRRRKEEKRRKKEEKRQEKEKKKEEKEQKKGRQPTQASNTRQPISPTTRMAPVVAGTAGAAAVANNAAREARRTDRTRRRNERRDRRSDRRESDDDSFDSSSEEESDDPRSPSPASYHGLPDQPIYSIQHVEPPRNPEDFPQPVYANQFY